MSVDTKDMHKYLMRKLPAFPYLHEMERAGISGFLHAVSVFMENPEMLKEFEQYTEAHEYMLEVQPLTDKRKRFLSYPELLKAMETQ